MSSCAVSYLWQAFPSYKQVLGIFLLAIKVYSLLWGLVIRLKATHHLIKDSKNLIGSTTNNGTESVTVCIGYLLSTQNFGYVDFRPSNIDSSLQLYNFLHTHSISHNLVSLNKFCSDNNDVIEGSHKKCFGQR